MSFLGRGSIKKKILSFFAILIIFVMLSYMTISLNSIYKSFPVVSLYGVLSVLSFVLSSIFILKSVPVTSLSSRYKPHKMEEVEYNNRTFYLRRGLEYSGIWYILGSLFGSIFILSTLSYLWSYWENKIYTIGMIESMTIVVYVLMFLLLIFISLMSIRRWEVYKEFN